MADDLVVHHPVDDDPAVYARRSPTPEEHLLAELCGNGHDGAPVPLHFFTKIAVRLKRIGMWAASLEDLRRKLRANWRRGVAMLGANALLIAGLVLHRVASDAAAAEHLAAQERAEVVYREGVTRLFELLEKRLDHIERRLDRLTGADQPGPSGDPRDIFRDKLSSLNLRGPTCTFSSASPPP
ncbi:MAG TPA: hypothetical protein VFZ00_11280 [Solirubrobacter sp.]|nr:hypothetical protein [Solirubrobacter sp.]